MKKFASLCVCSLITVAFAGADQGEMKPIATLAQAATGKTGTVRGDRTNVRSRPSTTAEVVGQLKKGDAVEIRETKAVTEAGKSREWLRIGLPAGAKCFVATKHVAGGASSVEGLNVRCGPGENYRDIGKLTKGEKLEAVGKSGEWTQIKPTPECSGWIAADLVDVVAAAPEPVATEIVTPAVVAPLAPMAEPTEVKVISTDPDVHVQYVVKIGVVKPATGEKPAGNYELRTPESNRIEHRICYLETGEVNLNRYLNHSVRISGNEKWQKGERYPVLAVERVDIIW